MTLNAMISTPFSLLLLKYIIFAILTSLWGKYVLILIVLIAFIYFNILVAYIFILIPIIFLQLMIYNLILLLARNTLLAWVITKLNIINTLKAHFRLNFLLTLQIIALFILITFI